MKSPVKLPSFPRKIVLTMLVGLLAIGILVGAGFFSWKYLQAKKTITELKNRDKAAEEEVSVLVETVGKIILLPDGTPTIATVTDQAKLQNQQFFTRSVNGDKVLIFPEAKKAYLYRPSSNQIIDVASLNIQATGEENVAAATPSPTKFVVAIYNGTTTAGLTANYEKKLKPLLGGATVGLRQNAAVTTYEKSFLVDLKGGQDALVQEISQKLNLPVQTLPEGEPRPAGDVLIILGTDAFN